MNDLTKTQTAILAKLQTITTWRSARELGTNRATLQALYSDLEERLGADKKGGKKWLAEHLGLKPRQLSNYRNFTTEPPKLVLDKMKSMIKNGESYER